MKYLYWVMCNDRRSYTNIIEGNEEWEVAEILDFRKRYNKKQYLVSWKGFGAEHNSWEPEIHLKNSQDLLQEFNIKFPNAAKDYKRKRGK